MRIFPEARPTLPVCLLIAVAMPMTVNVAYGQNAGPSANSDAAYQALRNITLGTEAITVKELLLKRDAGTFILHSGTVCFLPPVNGKVTGAVFSGDGQMTLVPPTESETKSLRYLTKEDQFGETFDRLVLRFTDGT